MGQSCCGGGGGTSKARSPEELEEEQKALRAKIGELYKKLDLDGSGNLDANEFLTAYTELHPDAPKTLEEIAKMIEQYDADGDKQISLPEFEAMMKKLSEGEADQGLGGLALDAGGKFFGDAASAITGGATAVTDAATTHGNSLLVLFGVKKAAADADDGADADGGAAAVADDNAAAGGAAPEAGSEAAPAPAPVADSEPAPAPAPAADSEPAPAPAPAADSEPAPAPAPVVS